MIKSVEYINDYLLHVVFKDGQERLVDLYSFLSTSTFPFISKYLDLDLFKQVRVDYGTIAWGDNDMDINPLSIYYGEFEAADSPYKEDIKAVVKARKLKEIDDRMKRRIDRAKKDAQREKKLVMTE